MQSTIRERTSSRIMRLPWGKLVVMTVWLLLVLVTIIQGRADWSGGPIPPPQ